MVARIHGKAQHKRDLIIKFLETGNNIDYIKKSFHFFIEHEDYEDVVTLLNNYCKCRAIRKGVSPKKAFNDFKNGILDSLVMCRVVPRY